MSAAALVLLLLSLPLAPALAAEHGESGEKVKRSELIYEKFYGLTVNLFSQDQVEGQFLVSLDLEARSKYSDEIKHIKPRLTDAYNRRLIRFGQTILDTHKPIDIRRLEYVLQKATDRVLGPGIGHVLLNSALINDR